MIRSDKKNRECISCRKAFSTPQKLCQNYKSNKNQCSLLLENNTQRNVPRPGSPSPALIDHVRGRNGRKEKSKVVNPIPDLQLVIQIPVLETESQRNAPVLDRDYITEEEAKNWINPNAGKSREHVRLWGARLQKRGKELNLEDHDIPLNLDGYKTLFHDLEQYDPEAICLLTLKELEKYQKGEAGPILAI